MRKKVFIILILCMFLLLASCSKKSENSKHIHIFNEFYECTDCDFVREGYDFRDKTSLSINKNRYKFKIDNIEKNKVRRSSSIVSYNYKQPLEVDSSGYEVAVNKYGEVIEIGVNVMMPSEGIVFSATGSYKDQLKYIKVGNFAIYDLNTLYIYEDDETSKYHSTISKFYDTFLNIRKRGLIADYQKELSDLFPKLKEYSNDYDKDVEEEILNILESIDLKNESVVDLYDHTHQYTYIGNKLENYQSDPSVRNVYTFYTAYSFYTGDTSNIQIYHQEDDVIDGGFYISVDAYGIVREKGINVNSLKSGYVIGGFNDARAFIINHVEVNDKVKIESHNDDNVLNVYKDVDLSLKNNFIRLRNEIVKEVNDEIAKQIPHDYQFIYSIMKRIDNIIDYHEYESIIDSNSVYQYVKYFTDLDMINDYVNLIYSQLIDNQLNKNRGIWYYPFLSFNNVYLYDDTTLEGIRHTLKTMKNMGINHIYLLLFTDLSSGYLLYDSQYYEKLPLLNTLNYGEYGNDYVLCFISEAHKLGMAVTAYTQTFYAHMPAMKDKKEDYHIRDFYGNVSKDGNYDVYYYDVSNDNLQEFLIDYYQELVNKYDFDGIEYDFIRYPYSNLSEYRDVEAIPENKQIIDHGYTDYSMIKFMNLYNLEGNLKELIRTSKDVRSLWLEFKWGELNGFVGRLSEAIRNIKPNIRISAAVFPHNASSIDIYMQDYVEWIQEGYVDAIEPMNYTDQVQKFVDVNHYLYQLNLDAEIHVGIGAKLTSENLLNDLKQVRAMDRFGDYAFFSAHYYYRDTTFVRLMSINHHYPYLSLRSTPEEILHAKCFDTIQMIHDYWSKSTDVDYTNLLSALENKNTNQIKIEISKIDIENIKEYLLRRFK